MKTNASDIIALIALFLTPVWAAFGAWFGSRLQRQSFVEQIHYSKFHEHRAEVLQELYKLVVDARRAFPLNVPIGNWEKLDEQGYKFIFAAGDLRERYEEKVLWLDDEIKRPLDRFLEETEDLAVQLGKLSQTDPVQTFGQLKPGELREWVERDPETAAEFHAAFEEMLKDRRRIAADLEDVRAALETEFRKTLKGERIEEAGKGRGLFGG